MQCSPLKQCFASASCEADLDPPNVGTTNRWPRFKKEQKQKKGCLLALTCAETDTNQYNDTHSKADLLKEGLMFQKR